MPSTRVRWARANLEPGSKAGGRLRLQPSLRGLIERWDAALPDVWLSGSVMAQTVWNARFGLKPEYGIADLDLVYFDGNDLSQEGEEAHRPPAPFACRSAMAN
jgi:hypothetical protein